MFFIWKKLRMELGEIRCFQHCDRKQNILCFIVPIICPLCGQDLTQSRLRIPPYIIESPFTEADITQCSLVIKPTIGHFLYDFSNNSNLHIGLTDSSGNVYEFDERGVTVGDKTWTHCLSIKILDEHEQLENKWDHSLEQFANEKLWKKECYDENSQNCFDFVLHFLQCFELDRQYSCLVDKSVFCEKMILPATRRAGKYITLYKQIEESQVVIQNAGQ
ncbi:MKRN2 opposite strand protein-like [Mercenaria mercenaria]|uniref:MKRN2 opposite strand protein-like n=1 Tax=Mercenaria mercenaria TaxID=6596 RepID=UPI00234EC585|nr:MKRN2 opposite strand protein-like [Mercenaria mercenaria]